MVIDYFIAFFCKVFSVVGSLKEVSDWCGWIPTYSNDIEIVCEVGGGDGSVLSVQVIKKSKRFTLTKLGDVTFESGPVFLWALVSDRGDLKNTKFTICGEIVSVIFVQVYGFSYLSVCADGIDT